jgi:hypothetical protein
VQQLLVPVSPPGIAGPEHFPPQQLGVGTLERQTALATQGEGMIATSASANTGLRVFFLIGFSITFPSVQSTLQNAVKAGLQTKQTSDERD